LNTRVGQKVLSLNNFH